MVNKFEVGGVYNAFMLGTTTCIQRAYIPIKVTRISASRKTMWFCALDEEKRSRIEISDQSERRDGERATYKLSRGHYFYAFDFNCLHPWFPSGDSLCKAYLGRELPEWLCRFHKEIMKTFVLFFFSVKLVVIARRVKERMYAPGGIGSIAAQESFYRAAKSQHIE